MKIIKDCVTIYLLLNDPSGKICVPNKTENVNINVFNMITRVIESKTLIKHISCDCKHEFDDRKCISKLE